MIRKGGEHGLIGFDRVVEAVLLDETFRAIQLFDNVHAHAGSENFLGEVAPADTSTGPVRVKNTITCRACACQTDGVLLLNSAIPAWRLDFPM